MAWQRENIGGGTDAGRAGERSGSGGGAAARRDYWRLYAALFVAGFALRLGFALWQKTYVRLPGSILPFGLEICNIAQSIVQGKGYSSPFDQDTGPTAWVAPVYPLLAAAVFRIFGIFSTAAAMVLIALQCVMAAGTGVCIHALGRRTVGAGLGWWAAWIWTVSPIFFRWPVSWIWDFAASALLLCVALIVTLDTAEKGTRGMWLWLGAVWALIALTNPALISVMPFSFLYADFVNREARRRWLAGLAMAGMIFAVLVAPWLIRNAVVFGTPVFFRSNYWFEFHLGNYHLSNGVGYSGKHPTANPAEMTKYAEWGELKYIEYYKEDAQRFVQQYPREFAELTLRRTLWFWDGEPLRYWTREWWKPWEFWPLSALGWLGLIFALTRRPQGWILYAAVLIVYPVPYYLAYPVAKYRHAIEPELLLLATYFASVVWSEIRGRARPGMRVAAEAAVAQRMG